MTYLLMEDAIDAQLAVRAHQFIDWAALIQQIPHDSTYEGAYLGTYSLTLRDKSRTFVATHHAWCDRPVSASSVARLILKSGLKLLGRKRIFWNLKSKDLLNIPQPMFCKPCEFSEYLVYVDIKRAYYDIYSKLPLDIRFQGLRAYGGQVWMSDFLPKDLADYKIVRNSLVGVLRALTGSRIKKGKVDSRPNRNPLLSPEHWGFIAHLLHALASSAYDFGAHYYNTDGAIFMSDDDAMKWVTLLTDLGFTPHIRAQGPGYIRSIGNYKIGAQLCGRANTKPIKSNNLIDFSPYILKRWVQWR